VNVWFWGSSPSPSSNPSICLTAPCRDDCTDPISTRGSTQAHSTPAFRVETLAFRVETLAFDVDTLAFRVETLAFDVETLAFDVETLAFDVETLAFRVETPACRVETLASHVETLAFRVDTPAFHVDTPAFHVDTPAFHVDTPAFHVDTPAFHVDTPACRARRCTRATSGGSSAYCACENTKGSRTVAVPLTGNVSDGEAVVGLLRSNWVACVQGNHDANAVRRAREEGDFGGLSRDSIEWLANLPTELAYEWDGVRIVLAHAPRCGVDAYVWPDDIPKRLKRALRTVERDVVVLGHTHVPMKVKYLDVWLINPGSVRGTQTRDSHTCGVLSLPSLDLEILSLEDGRALALEYGTYG
jgi:putative phosphoesterase